MSDPITVVPSSIIFHTNEELETLKVFLGREKLIKLDLEEDGVAVNLSTVTRMKMLFGDTWVDSQTDTGVFDWDVGVTGRIHLQLGKKLTIPENLYNDVPLVLISPAKPMGDVWELPFQWHVIDLCD